MRHIKQLGVCAQVFPGECSLNMHSWLYKSCNLQKHMIQYCDTILGVLYLCSWTGATHNRFFHSIGTAYLAMTFIQNLRHEQPHLQVTDRDEMCVTLAGLCHDLGHPCFSHSDCLEIRLVWIPLHRRGFSCYKPSQLSQSAAILRSYVREQLVMSDGDGWSCFEERLSSKAGSKDCQSLRCMILRMITMSTYVTVQSTYIDARSKSEQISLENLQTVHFASTRAVWSFEFCYVQLLTGWVSSLGCANLSSCLLLNSSRSLTFATSGCL